MSSIWILLVLVIMLNAFVSRVYAMPRRRIHEMSPEQFFRALSPMFPKLSFAESECTSSKGRLGKCVSYPECEGPAVLREGTCSDGFGVCCVHAFSTSKSRSTVKSPSKRAPPSSGLQLSPDLDETEDMDGTASAGEVLLSNPDYPSPSKQPHWSVDIMVPREVCQIRLDFELLNLPLSKVFKVKLNGVVMAPLLTGNNSGQHLIINVATAVVLPARLELIVSGPPVPTSWKIGLQNIYCFSPALAPDGCTQYNLVPSGRVRSLSVASADPTPYAVCLRAPRPTANLISLRTLADKNLKTCTSFMQVPAGMSLNGEEIPTKVCPHDAVRLTYKVFGPLVLYMITSSGQRGIDVQYHL